MSDSVPPSEPSSESVPKPAKNKRKGLDWAALGSALASLVIGASAYVRSRSEPQAHDAYETLVVQVVKMQENASRNHEDLEKMRTYLEDQNKAQDEKLKAVADALEVVAHPPAPAAPSSSAHPVKAAVKKVKAVAVASANPPPALAPPPSRPDRASMDKTFKDKASSHDSAF